MTKFAKRVPDYETGYRHGKGDYCAGRRSQALIDEDSEYAEGYRDGLAWGTDTVAKWLEGEGT